MKTCLLAAALFAAPIIGVIAMNPEPAAQSVKNFQAWAEKTFPTPKPQKNTKRRRK